MPDITHPIYMKCPQQGNKSIEKESRLVSGCQELEEREELGVTINRYRASL